MSLTNKEFGEKWEKRTAKMIGGKLTRRSGAGMFDKGDVKTDSHLVECKATRAKSFAVSRAIWDKLFKHSVKAQKEPVLAIKFESGPELAVVDLQYLIQLINDAENTAEVGSEARETHP